MELGKMLLLVCLVTCQNGHAQKRDFNVEIPTGGNTWVLGSINQTSEVTTEKGITNWAVRGQVLRTYFYTDKIGKVEIGLSGMSASKSIINVSLVPHLKG